MAAAVSVAGLDLATKTIAPGFAAGSVIEPGQNAGLALGILDLATDLELLVMVLGLIVFGYWTIRRALNGRGGVSTAGLACGGALGNLVDRALFGSVRDFVATPWFVFNLADVALVVAVVLLYFDLWAGRMSASAESVEADRRP